jgi:hypothetical protein
MIGMSVTDETGKPLPQYTKLSQSAYQPSDDVKELFAQCQTDYSIAWRLQHRPFDEFDGISLLQRTNLDQKTFGAFVGAEFVPQQKRWRWRGRKNSARNKLMGICAHMIAGMLFPMVHAQNPEDEEDKITAQVMKIIVEQHLRKAGYEMKFLYMVLSALVNPAVFVEVEYLVAYQKIKERLADGSIQITEAVDLLLAGLNLNIIPIDQILLGDFYTGDLQRQPFIVRVNRISWDMARKIWGDHKDFEYVQAGKTRVFLTGQEHQVLYDIEWTEADRLAVQVITMYYRDEDLEVTFVGGVFMGEEKDIYNSNPFKHRRMSLIGDEYKTIPIYPFAKSGLEPIDPTGRFAYYKSGAFKEFWDDASQNQMHQLLHNGAYLEVAKPLFIDGVAKVDSNVISPYAVVGMPKDSKVTPFSLGPNLGQITQIMNDEKNDQSESTLSPLMMGQLGSRQTAYAVNAAMTNAKIMLGLTSFMIADLIRQVGELTMDVVIQNTTQGELDATIPEALALRYKTIMAKTKDKGKDITNKIVFTDALMGKKYTQAQQREKNWMLWEKAGGSNTDQRIFEVNPYRFARTTFSMWVDADAITSSAVGLNRDQKMENIKMLTLPFVAPFTDQKAVAMDVIEEYGGDDPDKFKAKGNVNAMMQGMMNGGQQDQQQNPGSPVPSPFPSTIGQGMVGAGAGLSANHPNR